MIECRLDRNPFLSVPLAQRGVRPLLGRVLPPLVLVAGLTGGGSLFIGIGLASVNQWGEHRAHLIPFSLMVPPAATSRWLLGGFFLFNHPALYGKVFSG